MDKTPLSILGACLLALAAPLARGQGGPPMITDDPGTPGNGHWEINVAWADQESPGSTLTGLPLLDANYGVGDRLQLNYQGSWNILRTDGQRQESGISDSQLAVKWRFFDAGGNGLQASMYPRVTFPTPDTGSDRRGTADPNTSLLLPFEFMKDLGILSLDVEVGRMFSAATQDRGWMGGICVGRQVMKGWELDAEVHVTASDGFAGNETILNAGTRIDLSEHATILLAAGADSRDTLGARTSLLTYAGIQIRL
ncbi:MAG TPA: hypothetical protein VGG34_04270 [Opitutaceae bacterium]